MKRTLSFALALMCVCSLAACGGGGGDTENAGNAADSAAVTTEAETVDELADNLPAADYQGYTFRLGASDENNAYNLHFFYTEEMNGETVNDAVYQANANVQERFNIKYQWVPIAGITNSNSYQAVQTAVQAGDDIYDLVTLHDTGSMTAVLAGCCYNIKEIPHLDFTRPWWPKLSSDSLTVNGRLYHISTDINYYCLGSTRAVFMNVDMAKDLNIEIPYDMVREGKWTLDAWMNMTKDAYVDVNGDGVKDQGDKYGFVITGRTYDVLEGFGIDVWGRTKDGKQIVLDFYNENTIKVVETTCRWLFSGGYSTFYDYSLPNSVSGGGIVMFNNGQTLFNYNSITRHVEACNDVNYTILPQPKLDENQADYHGGCNDNPLVVPVTQKDYDRTGMIIEAMSAEGHKVIRPAYIEVALKSRYAIDTGASEMLEIIFANRVLSGGYLFRKSDTGLQMVCNALWQNKSDTPDVASFYETSKAGEQQRIDEINKFYNQ